MALALVPIACGSSDRPKQSQLEADVSSAMSRLPYTFDFENKYSSNQYVVFRVNGEAAVNIAYGGKREGRKCPKPPDLPARHRRGSKAFPAAGPEPLICFDDDSWRPGSSESATIARSNAANLVAEALCEEVYRGFESFACFD